MANDNKGSLYSFGETGRESAEAVFSTTAGATVTGDIGNPADVATVEAAIGDIERSSTHVQQHAGIDAQTVAAGRDAVARAKQPGGSPTAAADLANIRNAVLMEKGKVDAEQVKELQQAVAGVGFASGALSAAASAELHAVRGSLSQVFTSMGAEMAANGNRMAIGSFGQWSEHSSASLGNVELPVSIPGQIQGPATGRYT